MGFNSGFKGLNVRLDVPQNQSGNFEKGKNHCPQYGKAGRICDAFCGRLLLKCDGTRAETRFLLSAKRKSPFKIGGGRQFSRLLAAEVCPSEVVMLDTPCSEVVWRVLDTHSIRQVSPSLPLPVRHRVPSHFSWILRQKIRHRIRFRIRFLKSAGKLSRIWK